MSAPSPASTSATTANTTMATAPSTTVPPTTQAPAGLTVGQPYNSAVPANCHLRGTAADPLPDPSCTPGALNPAVNSGNINSTICVSGYSKTIRPPSSFTGSLKRAQMAAWGISGLTSQTEEDHLVPLSLGGAPSDSRNLWPEPGGIPNTKDELEFRLYKLVCSGQVPLTVAQQAIATDWTAAYQRWMGPLPS